MTTSKIALWRLSSSRFIGAALVSVLLAACGGGGDEPDPIPTVSSVSVVAGTSKYSQTLVVAVTGTDVDVGLFISSAACTNAFLLNTAPYLSGYSTAYYGCRVSAVGTSQVAVGRVIDQVVLGSTAFTVPLPQVTMTVSEGPTFSGTMVFTLFPNNAPQTVNNFLDYVNTGFYLGTIFQRVNVGVVQGGGYLPLTQGVAPTIKAPTFAPIPLEVGRGLSNTLWSIGMARDPQRGEFSNLAVLHQHAGQPQPGRRLRSVRHREHGHRCRRRHRHGAVHPLSRRLGMRAGPEHPDHRRNSDAVVADPCHARARRRTVAACRRVTLPRPPRH